MEFTDEEIEAAARGIHAAVPYFGMDGAELHDAALAALQAFAAVRMKGEG